jgi:hypothetical protein
MRWLAGILVMLGMIGAGSPAHAFSCGGAYYRSSDGSCVHRPTKSGSNFGRITAYCRDGTHSMSHHRRGTCSRHRGVARWVG